MANVSPNHILAQVAAAMPPECLPNLIIIGSLAAGYHFFGEDRDLYVRTKDIDSVLHPRNQAIASGQAVAEKLLAGGWRHIDRGEHSKPGDNNTPTDQLPAVRLNPPGNKEWFLELLTLPDTQAGAGKQWLRLKLSTGHFGLPSFAFLPLSTYRPQATPFGLNCARPEMMALANLLEHPEIKPDVIVGGIAGRAIKRSNKDLGRVLALVRLAGPESIGTWAEQWREALAQCFPGRWKQLARPVGAGLRQLLDSADDLAEATHTCNNGLLAARRVTPEQLGIEGRRLLMDVIEPLEKLAAAS